jgi:hypothetical protein
VARLSSAKASEAKGGGEVNFRNCAAPVPIKAFMVCEYCGTEYGQPVKFTPPLSSLPQTPIDQSLWFALLAGAEQTISNIFAPPVVKR